MYQVESSGNPPAPADDAERIARLRLVRSDHVGPITFRELLRHLGNARAAVDALPSLAARGGRRRLTVFPKAQAEAEIADFAKHGGRHLFMGEADYPPALAAVEDAPPVLLLLGDAALLRRPAVAVVGARNASANGRRLAREIAAGLAAEGILVVSGMARGIDTAAHEGALSGGTAAVLAGGPDIVYPEENRPLYEAIGARGAILAESPPGLVPQARHFPRRNRIISGLSRGVVVVEAAPRSGSLITARLANEQGREVLAVPGSPLDPRCRGSNDLIRRGAGLVESAADVLSAIGGIGGVGAVERAAIAPPPAIARPPAVAQAAAADAGGATGDDAVRRRVVEALGPSPAPIDAVIRELGVAPRAVMTVLLELELAGRLQRLPGNIASLLPDPPEARS